LKVGRKKEKRFQKTRIIDVKIHTDEGRDQDRGQETETSDDAIDLGRDLETEKAQGEVIEVERHQDDAAAEVEAGIGVVGRIVETAIEVVVIEEAAIVETPIVGMAIVGIALVGVIAEIVTVVEDKQISKQRESYNLN